MIELVLPLLSKSDSLQIFGVALVREVPVTTYDANEMSLSGVRDPPCD